MRIIGLEGIILHEKMKEKKGYSSLPVFVNNGLQM